MSENITRRLTEKEYHNLDEFLSLATEILNFVNSNTVSCRSAQSEWASHYSLRKVKFNRSTVSLRPINTRIFIEDPVLLQQRTDTFKKLLDDLAIRRTTDSVIESLFDDFIAGNWITKVAYTIQQAIGFGYDVFVEVQQARKLAGIAFETLMKSIFDRLKISNDSLQFSTPIVGRLSYRCEIDRAINIHGPLRSSSSQIDPTDVLASIKVSSKDRMPKIFIDKILLQNITKQKPKMIAIIHNDVQRSGENKVSVTFVPDLFLVYWRFLVKLDGVYFVDPPPHAVREPWKNMIRGLPALILKDIWTF